MGQTARDTRQAVRSGRQTIRNSGRPERSSRQLDRDDMRSAVSKSQSVRNDGRRSRSSVQSLRNNGQPAGSRIQSLKSDRQSAVSRRQPIRNSTRSAGKDLQVIGDSGQIARYNGQASRNSKRSMQHKDVELWEINRESSPARQQKKGKPRQYRQGNPRPVQSIKRRRARRRKVYFYRAAALSVIVLSLVLIYFMTGAIYRSVHKDTGRGIVQILSEKVVGKKIAPPEIVENYLDINDYSRPGTELKKVNSIFVHYTANPGTTAEQNRSYFANLAETHERSASAHFIIGYDGTLLQCIPLDEEAYAVKTRNGDSISIECCYLSEDGSFTQETYDTLIHTLAWLIDEYHLSADDILRHYDCGGKLCPLYYAEHEDAWNKLREDVANYENPEDIH